MTTSQDELVALSRRLGEPVRDLAILAEGNTSALGADGTFLVKASGASLSTAQPDDFVHVDSEPLLDIVSEASRRGPTDAGQARLDAILSAATSPDGEAKKASIETLLHALGYGFAEASWVAHTHPTPVVSLVSSTAAPRAYAECVFPDEAVVCGPAPLYVPYAEPGLRLAVAVYDALREHMDIHGAPPRQVLLGNHGLLAFGRGPTDVEAVTAMAVKAARVRLGALGAGGMAGLPAEQSSRLAGRPDERGRRALFTDRSADGQAAVR